MCNHNQFLLSIVSYSFYLFGEFAEVLILTGKSDAYNKHDNKLICIVERVHFHARVGVKKLDKILFAIFFAEICCNSLRQRYKATNIVFVCFFNIVKCYNWENKLDREFRELKQQNHNRYSDWSKKAPPGLTQLIISAIF